MNSSTLQPSFVDEDILVRAMAVQLDKWKCKLESGHKRVGWKIGFNTKDDQSRMGLTSPIVGHLTSESTLDSGGVYKGNAASKLMVEAEVAIFIGQHVPAGTNNEQAAAAIEGFAPAIEIVDFARSPHDMTSILEDNIFHETVIFGELTQNDSELKAKDINANVLVNGQSVKVADHSRYPDEFSEIVVCVANRLAKQGECLQEGDWIISGSITQPVEVHSGDQVDISLSPLGSLIVNIVK
jgi:2-oxo-hept-3-ene-1,7-dioate hydratase